jgi:accessory colonization factor AcfC
MTVIKDNPDLMERLIKAQNHPIYHNQDICTFAAFMDDRDEFLKYVESKESFINKGE